MSRTRSAPPLSGREVRASKRQRVGQVSRSGKAAVSDSETESDEEKFVEEAQPRRKPSVRVATLKRKHAAQTLAHQRERLIEEKKQSRLAEAERKQVEAERAHGEYRVGRVQASKWKSWFKVWYKSYKKPEVVPRTCLPTSWGGFLKNVEALGAGAKPRYPGGARHTMKAGELSDTSHAVVSDAIGITSESIRVKFRSRSDVV